MNTNRQPLTRRIASALLLAALCSVAIIPLVGCPYPGRTIMTPFGPFSQPPIDRETYPR